jgi:hypothetical protein
MKLFGEKKILELDSDQKRILRDLKKEWSELVTVSGKNPTSPETDGDIDWLYEIAGFSKPKIVTADSFSEYQKIRSFTSSTKSLTRSYPINHNIHKKFRGKLIRNTTKRIEKYVDNDIILELIKLEQVFTNKIARDVLETLNSNGQNYLNRVMTRQPNFGLSTEFWMMTGSFFERIGYLDDRLVKEDFTRYSNMMMRGIWHASFFKDVAILCSTPKKTKKDDQGRLHSVSEAALQWKDDQNDYFIHGVMFEEDLWEKVTKRELKIKEMLQIQNIEQRHTAIQLYGYNTLIDEIDAELMNRSKRGNELYLLNNSLIRGRSIKLLKYKCPSTDRIYFSFVPDDMHFADNAMAWKFNLTPKEYDNLDIET